MKTKINPQALSQLNTTGNLSAKLGSIEWSIAIRLEMQSNLHDIMFNAEQLKAWIKIFEE